MKKNYLMMLILTLVALPAFAQEDGKTEVKPFNKWSIDFGVGVTHPLNKSVPGYSSPTIGFGAAELGARYMINEMFGVKGAFYYNQFSNKSDSPDFTTHQYRFNLEGVMNIGRIMRFESWTRTLNLLAHGGVGVGLMNYDLNNADDWVGSGIAGLTAQIRLSDRVAINVDGNYTVNARQDYSFAGVGKGASHNYGMMFNGTAGLSVYLGKHKKHADWHIRKEADNEALYARIAALEAYNKGANYAKRDDLNATNREVDDLKRKVDGIDRNNASPTTYEDFAKQLINEGYVNIFFSLNSSQITTEANAVLGFIEKYMSNNSGASLQVNGYADETGPADYNRKLSERRAGAAAKVLVDAGISGSRISSEGKGVYPGLKQLTRETRGLARRVTFVIK